MHYVYVLRSKTNNSFYIGITANLVRRIKEHNLGKCFTTKKHMPWTCIYFEGYFSEDDAKTRERNLKIFGKAFGQLKQRLKNTLQISER